MARRTQPAAPLQDLVRLAVPICRQAASHGPKRPGRPPQVPDWLLAVLLMVAVLQRKKTKSAPYRFLSAHRVELARWLGSDRFPGRSTYFDRYRRAHRLFRQAIRLHGRQAVADGLADPEIVAVDKSLLAGLGPDWHKRQRDRGDTPAGVDVGTTWGYSEHHGWMQGYSYEVVVTATAGGVVWPLLASVDTASVREASTFADKIPQLPAGVRYVDADSAYDVDAYGRQIERDEADRPTGRRFCARRSRATARGSVRGRRQSDGVSGGRFCTVGVAGRSTAGVPRPWSRSMSIWRGCSSWSRPGTGGLDNNRTQVLVAVFAYQVLLRYNHRQGRHNAQIKDIVDRL